LSDEQIRTLAHRICSEYTHEVSPKDRWYDFADHTLLQFARAIIAAAKVKADEH